MDRILDFLSDYSIALTYQQLPKDVLHAVKRIVIDTLGCAIGSYHMVPPQIARAHALEVISKPGSTILGTRHRSSPELASFANGVMSRYLDFNDTSMSGAGGHPSDNIMAILAAAEYAGTDMQTTITAIILAYEVQNRIGSVSSDIRASGWEHAVYVVLASAAGAGKVMGLNKEQLANALALAAVPNAAMVQARIGRLSMWKGCTAANAARNGVFAALLARRGMTGPDEAFEGPRGYKKQLGTVMELPAFAGNGTEFTILSSKIKCFPCMYEPQCAITPALELHKVLIGKLDQIDKIEVETYEFAVQAAADTRDKWSPANRETADHSIPYVVAVALARGTVWLDDFEEVRIREPAILALMQKIEVRATEELTRAWPAAYPFRITVTTKSGEKHIQEVRHAKGHPKNPISDQEIEAKFRKLAEPVMGKAQTDKALKRLWRLEKIKSARSLLRLFELDTPASHAGRT